MVHNLRRKRAASRKQVVEPMVPEAFRSWVNRHSSRVGARFRGPVEEKPCQGKRLIGAYVCLRGAPPIMTADHGLHLCTNVKCTVHGIHKTW